MKNTLKQFLTVILMFSVVVVFGQNDKSKKKEVKIKVKNEINGKKIEWDTVMQSKKDEHFDVHKYLQKRFPELDADALKDISMEMKCDGNDVQLLTFCDDGGKIHKFHKNIKFNKGDKSIRVIVKEDSEGDNTRRSKAYNRVYVYRSHKDEDSDFDVDFDFEILSSELKNLDELIKVEVKNALSKDSLHKHRIILDEHLEMLDEKLIHLDEHLKKIKIEEMDGAILIHKSDGDGHIIKTIEVDLDDVHDMALSDEDDIIVLKEMHEIDELKELKEAKEAKLLVNNNIRFGNMFNEKLNVDDFKALAANGIKSTGCKLPVKSAHLFKNDGVYNLKFDLRRQGKVFVKLISKNGKTMLKSRMKDFSGDFNMPTSIRFEDDGTYYLYVTYKKECYASKIKLD